MSDLEKYRHLNQDNWKRTQVRMPQETYEEVSTFAKDKKLSLNSALITLVEEMLSQVNEEKTNKDNSGHLGVEYKMRLSEDLRNRIKESAKQHNRSMNQDIVARLEQTFNNASDINDLSLEFLLGKVADRLGMVGLHMELFSRTPKEDGTLPAYKEPTS